MSKKFPLRGIRGRLLLLLLIVLVPVLFIEVFIYYQRFETRKSEELQANLEMARAVAKNFDTFVLDIVHGELVIGLALTSSQPMTDRDQNRILDNFQTDNPAVRSCFWVNPGGLIVASSLRAYIGFDVSDRSFVKEIITGRNWTVSELIVGKATGKPAFTVSRGIRNEQGKLLGIVAASVEPDRLDSVLGIGRSKDAGVSLVDNKGMLAYRYPATEYATEQRDWLTHYPMIEDSLKGKDVLANVVSESTGKKRLVAFAPVPSMGWVAAASRGEDEVMKAITSTLLFQAGLVFLVTLAGFGAAVALARPITNSIIGLRNHALALARGEAENLAVGSGPDELKDLTVAFNQMAGEVRLREAALRETEQRWVTTLASIGDAVIATDLSGKITFMNKVAEELTGWTLSEASTIPVADVFHIINEHTRNRVEDPIVKVLREGVIAGLANHTILVRKDGTEAPIDDSGAPIRDGEGKTLGVVLVFHDITERKRAEEERERLLIAVREEKDRQSALINSIQDEVWFADTEKNFTLANASAFHEFGLNGTTEIDVRELARSLEVYRPDGTPRPVEEAPPLRALQGEVVTNQEETIRTPRTGELRVRQVSATPVKDAGGHVIGSVSVVRDITERKRAEEDLRQRTLELQRLNETLEQRVRERTAELATLSSELLVAQEKERRRIAYNLHDNVWQTLEIIKTQLENLFSREDEADWPAFHRKAKQLVPVIRDTIARVRSMQGDLWPSVLDDIGIVATLEWYCREFGINHPGLGIEKNVGLAEDEVPASAKIVIYRVMQEALSNVAKHSQASHVSLSLNKSDHRLEFVIKDDGIGFDPEEAIVKRSPWGGMGLLSMKERTELSGGLFGVESAKGKGTTVRASWLLSGNN
jgi:PAS domain S-box-containing protein